MDESTIKGLKSLKLNDSGAESRKPRSTRTTISVEGYDNSLHMYPLTLALEKHFSSCGEIQNIFVSFDSDMRFLSSVAFMRIVGEGAEEKALALCGTDVGGWTAIVKATPSQKVFGQLPPSDTPSPITTTHTLFVSGYDTSLPAIDIKISLCQHFSSCGKVWGVHVLPSGRAFLDIEGDGSVVDRALNLSGRNMDGMTLVVERPRVYPKKRGRPTTIGYTLPCILREQAKKKKRMESEATKKKKRMETKKIKKEKKIEKAKKMNVNLKLEMEKM